MLRDWINQSISDRGVCRTVPATPGLLKHYIHHILKQIIVWGNFAQSVHIFCMNIDVHYQMFFYLMKCFAVITFLHFDRLSQTSVKWIFNLHSLNLLKPSSQYCFNSTYFLFGVILISNNLYNLTPWHLNKMYPWKHFAFYLRA